MLEAVEMVWRRQRKLLDNFKIAHGEGNQQATSWKRRDEENTC